MEKTCARCGTTKPADQFHKEKARRDGLSSYCKPCNIEKARITAVSAPKRRVDPPGMKRCQTCKETKPHAEFWAFAKAYDGLQKSCIACAASKRNKWGAENKPHLARKQKEWRDENLERSRDFGRRSRYGLPMGAYGQMFAAQEGRCAICQREGSNGRGGLHIDHCHDTGTIRGLLCHGCNVSIGHFHHDPEILRAAITYLGKYSKD